jgi:hypothetical protein
MDGRKEHGRRTEERKTNGFVRPPPAQLADGSDKQAYLVGLLAQTWPRPRMVKKPEHRFVAGVTHQLSSNFRLADEALHHAYSTPIEDSNGGG